LLFIERKKRGKAKLLLFVVKWWLETKWGWELVYIKHKGLEARV